MLISFLSWVLAALAIIGAYLSTSEKKSHRIWSLVILVPVLMWTIILLIIRSGGLVIYA